MSVTIPRGQLQTDGTPRKLMSNDKLAAMDWSDKSMLQDGLRTSGFWKAVRSWPSSFNVWRRRAKPGSAVPSASSIATADPFGLDQGFTRPVVPTRSRPPFPKYQRFKPLISEGIRAQHGTSAYQP